jgi:hypothetical protein
MNSLLAILAIISQVYKAVNVQTDVPCVATCVALWADISLLKRMCHICFQGRQFDNVVQMTTKSDMTLFPM